jgi:hypothetical protein
MYGRIGAEVREKRGLAYYSFSRLDGGLGPGSWRVVAGVNPENVDQAVGAIVDELHRITDGPVTDEELADNKANFIGRLPLQLESNEGVAASILTMERYGLGLNYLRDYAGIIQAVTAEEILAAARRYLDPDAYALAIAGPELPAVTAAPDQAAGRRGHDRGGPHSPRCGALWRAVLHALFHDGRARAVPRRSGAAGRAFCGQGSGCQGIGHRHRRRALGGY